MVSSLLSGKPTESELRVLYRDAQELDSQETITRRYWETLLTDHRIGSGLTSVCRIGSRSRP
ncbi:hypothetical protein AJ80_08292 [Polytolypa hystricis UAMH7299]|uniref:Uncharacterized protein n=1 Tax=Polytolypa hystricis (strain UAMH7299) TaxID=1447883 RepID=A0A2B7X9S3_POLH7|nr:hypothetical protein AJ80_08292 [Polytolypa hystricis UAMH7299]